MADTDIVQVIAEARVDATSLSEFVFKPSGFKVTRRLAPTIDTLQFYIDRFNSLNGDFSSSVSVALSSLNNSVAEANGKVAYIETTVQDAINNTAAIDGVLADTFVTVTSKFTGDVVRTQRAKNSDMVSVKDFGAVGDGVTDDQPAIQRAVDYMHSIGGGSLYLPRGKYIIKSTITWKTKVSMYGEGMGVSIIASVGDIFSAIANTEQGSGGGGDPSVEPLEDITFADFEVDCSGLTYDQASVGGKGLFILYMRRARFLNIYVHDSIGTGIGCDFLEDTLIHGCVVERAGRNILVGNNGGGQSGIGVGTGWKEVESLTISDCFVKDCGNYGIFVETQEGQSQTVFATTCRVVNCYAEGNRYSYGNKGSGGVMWIGCESNAAIRSGFIFSQNARGDSIDSCKIYNSGNCGVEAIFYAGNFSVRNCQIFNNGRDGVFLKPQGSGDAASDFHISNCVIKDNGYNGVVFAGSGREIMYYSVTGCNIRDNGKAELSNNRLGIYLANTLSFGRISDNWIGNSDGNSSQVEPIKSSFATINQLDIVNNTFYGHSSDAANVSGSNVRINNNFGHNNKAYSYPVNLGESPATYTASTADETLYLVGADIRVDIAGTKIVEGVTQAAVQVPANQTVNIIYTTMTMARKMY